MTTAKPITEHRRAEACRQLAEVLERVNATAAAVTTRLVKLSTHGYASDQKAIASFSTYQNSGLLCGDEIQGIEALLRGESIAATAGREQKRRETAEAKETDIDLRRRGYVQIPQDQQNAEGIHDCRGFHAACIVDFMWRMSADDLSDLYNTLKNSNVHRRPGKRAIPGPAPKRERATPASPFQVIDGGRG